MSSYTIATAKEHLSRLIDEALAGEPVTITRDGRPVAELRASAPAAGPKSVTQAGHRLAARAARKTSAIGRRRCRDYPGDAG